MAGMAWTLHPALFYEKYGTVLVQLWESGDVGTLFDPVRRLSRSIGDRITSLHCHHSDTLTATTKAGAVGGAVESRLTDDSVITEDDAMSRVNREPGYTSSKSSGSASSEFGWKRRGFQRRGSSILASKKNKGLRKADGGGTPLTDMEGVQPVRAVVIDVSGSPGDSSPSEDENIADKASGKRGGVIKTADLLEKNESLQTFRGIRGTGQRGRRSPPPMVRVPSESHTDTDSVASTSSVGQAPVACTPPLKKLEQPFVAAKSHGHSALRKRKSPRRRDIVAPRGKPVTALEKSAPVATVDAASVVFDRPRAATESSSVTSLLWRKEPVATDKCPEPSSQVKSDAKKDASKRRKPKGESKRKKMKDKSKTTLVTDKTSHALSVDACAAGGVDAGAANEDEQPRRKLEAAVVDDSARSLRPERAVAGIDSSTSTRVTASPSLAETTRSKDAWATAKPVASASTPGMDNKRPSVVDKTMKSASDVAMVHSGLPNAVRDKVEDVVKTSTPPRVEVKQRSARRREERAAEAKPFASTQTVVGPSSEALGISTAASGRTSGVNKRRSKKHSTSKTPVTVAAVETSPGAPLASTKDVERESTRAASPDNVDRVFDEAAAVHNHPHHRRQRRSKSKKHAKKGGGKRHSRNVKEDVAVASATVVTGGELLPASTTDNYGYGGPFNVEGSDVATTPFKKPSLVAAPSQPFYALPPTADVTLTGTDTALLPGGQRHAPRVSTVIKGDDVTVHLDLTSRDRAAMFWPFGRRGKKKRQPEQP
ncbi:hypothetical protein MRX96_052076 [Rhipicephalus microplus]